MKLLDRTSVVVGLLVAAFMAGAGWISYTTGTKVDALEKRIDRVEEKAADARCTAIVSRQVVAIEKGKTQVNAMLDRVMRKNGCYQRYDVMLASGAVSVTPESIRRWEAEERRRKAAFERDMTEIDKALGLHPDLSL